jgi:hypothetical protein
MKKYSVLVHGQNYLIPIDGEIENLGFYTTRYVEAEDSNLAEFNAVEIIRNDAELNETLKNSDDNPPMLLAEEITELKNFGEVDPPGSGYSFYRGSEKLH